MSIRGFVLQPTYQLERGEPVVHLWSVLEDGRPALIRDDRTRPRFYVRASDREQAAALRVNFAPDDPATVDLAGRPVVAIQTRKPADVPPLRDRLREKGVATYEADVRFAYRYLLQRGIRAAFEVEGESHDDVGVTVFANPELRPAHWRPEFRVLSIDIETDPQAKRLLSVALVGCGANDVLLLTEDGQSCPPGATPFPSELDLLTGFADRVRELDPDVITGWNVVDFDLVVLARIAANLGTEIPCGRRAEPLRVRPSAGTMNRNEVTLPGRVVLDGMALVRGAFLRYDSYSLDFVANEVLGVGKTMADSDRGREILRMWHEDRQSFVTYNRRDAELVPRILDELQLLPLTVERCLLTGMPPNRVAASIASFDFLYLTELSRRGIVAPTVEASDRSMAQSGGTVLESHSGLHEFVGVFDFKSLYPSLIRTFQIDPLGWQRAAQAERNGEDPPGGPPIVAPNGARFSREPGILPGLLDDLFPAREQAKRDGNEVASQAIKILMNSFYGVLGTPACRFAASDLANAITGWGRELLLWSRDRIEGKGLRVLYGDTDSLFVATGAADAASARAVGERLAAELDAEIAAFIRDKWGVESKLELEFETLYLALFLPPMRGSTAGAAKRYVGLEDAQPEPRLSFTGMETVRRDWTDLAKHVQREMYRRMFAHEPVEEYLENVVARVRGGELDEELVYRKGLRKKLERYTTSTPPHVAAARKMKKRPGPVIEYVITENGPEPWAEMESKLDREHYVQKQVRPVAEPVLGQLGLDFNVVVGDDRQLELF